MLQEKPKLSIFQNVVSLPRVKWCDSSERALLFSGNGYRLLKKALSVLENTMFASVFLCEWFILSVHHASAVFSVASDGLRKKNR